MFRVTAVLSLTACSAAAPQTESRPSLISDRPDFTEATAIVPSRMVQAEVGYTVAREGSLHATTAGEVLVRAGLTSKAELRVAANSWVRERERDAGIVTSGREDASLGFKFNLVEGTEGPSWRPELSIITHTTVPTGSAAFRSSRLQPEIKVLTAWTLTERFAFSSNLNIGRPYDGARSFMEYAGSASLGVVLTDKIGGYVEGFGFAPQDGSGQVNKFVNGGFTYLLKPEVQLDVRAGIGPTGSPAHSHFYGIGLVVRR